MAFLDRVRSLVQRRSRPSTWSWFSTFTVAWFWTLDLPPDCEPWPWFQSLDGGASWRWFSTVNVAWFWTLTFPPDCRPCAACGDIRPADQIEQDHCTACLCFCVPCNTKRPVTTFPTYDHPALTGHVCHRHRAPIRCTTCEQTKDATAFTIYLLHRKAIDTSNRVVRLVLGTARYKQVPLDPQTCDECLQQYVCRVCHQIAIASVAAINPFGVGGGIDKHVLHKEISIEVSAIGRRSLRDRPIPPACVDCAAHHVLTPDELAHVRALTSRGRSVSIDPTTPSDRLTLGATPDGAPVTISDTDRTRHMYLIGGTGSGKSVTLTNLAAQDLRAGRGFTVIDPHGDLVADPERGLLARVSPDQFDRVVYFDPTHDDAPSFNLLAADFEPSKLTTDLVATFKMFFGDSWGVQMEHLLRNAFLTLLADRHHEPHSFADVRTLLIDKEYREAIVDRAAPDYASFWHEEYPQLTKDAARPILTRLGALLVPGSIIRRVMSSTANDLNVRTIMDTGGVLLVNLSKGALGEQPAKLLGGLIVTAITQAALARQAIPEKDRTPHTLYCDEFQNFADLPSTKDILSEARKYQLRLVLAHQTMSQVDAALMSNILGNVRTVIGFNVSPEDAGKLVRRMARTQYLHPETHVAFDLTRERKAYAAIVDAAMKPWPIDPTRYRLDSKPPAYGQLHPNTALKYLTETAAADATTYEPPPVKGRPWRTTTWPTVQHFQSLPTCHAFIFRNVNTNTCELRVPFPPTAPYPDNLDRWHARRAAEMKPPPPADENRPQEKPQDERNASDAAPTPHPEPIAPPKPGDDFDEFLT